MDNISLTNLYSFSVSELNTKFNDKCHLDWSKSDLISAVSLEGIYILRPQLDIQHGPFRIELIRNPKAKFRHLDICNIGPSFDRIWPNLTSDQYIEAYLDPALTTNIEQLSSENYPRRFRLAKWSPVVPTYPKQCLLATLTIDYQLQIYVRKGASWVVQTDLSHEYDKLWAQLNDEKSHNEEGSFDIIRKNLHSLSFCNVCWKEMKVGGPILLAATIPGDIVVWQCTTGQSLEGKLSDYQFDAKAMLRTNLDNITSMQLHENLLIVSVRDGQVVLYDLTSNFSIFETTDEQQVKGQFSIKTLNVITIPATVILWHRDNIEVNDFYTQPLTHDTFRIVLAKSTNICWCIIHYKKKVGAEPATLAISDTFSAIDGLDPEVSLHQTAASWLRPAGDRKAILIADDGSFFQIEFIDDRQDTSPDFQAIRTGRVDLTRMVPRGLCTSPNGHLIAMASSIALMYDPSKIQAPTKMLILPTLNDKKFFLDCINKLLDTHWLTSNQIKSPMDVCDQLDYIRSIYPLLTKENLYDLSKLLVETALKVIRPETMYQLNRLKIAAFLLMKLSEHMDVDTQQGDQKLEGIEEIYHGISLHYIENLLANIFAKPEESFTNRQLISLRNYFCWLNQQKAGTSVKELYTERYNRIRDRFKREVTIEQCPICKSEIEFIELAHGTCKNGHRFDRCQRSLLILNLGLEDKLVCEHCNRQYLTYMIWSSDEMWLCLYCQ